MVEPDAASKAEALITEFGSVGATLVGSPSRISRVGGQKASVVIQDLSEILRYVLFERLVERPVLGNGQALLDYLRASIQHRTKEEIRILHLNARNVLLKDEIFSEGTVDKAAIYIREAIARCLEVGSVAIILVHNHPSGDPTPSRADIELTHAFVRAAELFEITVHDHLVIGTNGHTSLRAKGII